MMGRSPSNCHDRNSEVTVNRRTHVELQLRRAWPSIGTTRRRRRRQRVMPTQRVLRSLNAPWRCDMNLREAKRQVCANAAARRAVENAGLRPRAVKPEFQRWRMAQLGAMCRRCAANTRISRAPRFGCLFNSEDKGSAFVDQRSSVCIH